jgi:O-antigen/teichoic acid export membrane protein
MSGKLAQLARHSMIYGIGSSLGVAGSFLLIPLYTHALIPSEYGALELLYRTSDILTLVMLMGVRQAYLRFHFDRADDAQWQRQVLGTTVAFVLLSSAFITALVFPFTGLAEDTLFRKAISSTPILLLLAWIPLEMIVNIGLAHLQVRMQSMLFVTVNLVRLVVFLVLNVVLVYVLKKGVTGVLLAQVIVTGAIALAMMVYFIRWTRLALSLSLMKDLIRFGLPYLPASFFMYIIANSDRYFLGAAVSLESLGIYALAVKIGMVGTMLLVDPFLKVWSPFLYSHYDKPDGPELLGRVVTLFMLASVAFGLLVSVFTPIVLPWISGPEYLAASNLVPIVCLATVVYSLTHLADAGILIAKKTRYKPFIFGVAAGAALLANATLIPLLGALGAAVASVLTYSCLLAVNMVISGRFYRFPVEVQRITLILAAGVITYLLSLALLRKLGGDAWAMTASVAALGLFPALLWLTGFFTDGERAVIQRLLRPRQA